jgi:hypothetical protein
MGGTELKTDSFQRWMMYSKDAYASGRIFLSTEQKEAVEEGKKFSQRAYADIWAKDTALVRRVRAFLGTNFHWHERLAKNGADLEVIETLQSMIRGESVVLIAEQSRTGGAGGNPPPKPQWLPSFRSSLMNDCGMSYDAATAYIDRYNDMVDRANAVAARYANAAPSSLAHAASDLTGTATPLGDAQPFDYQPDMPDGDVFDLAKTPNDGEPGTWYTNPGSGQMRLFGNDGNPVVDLDFDHVHNGLRPHAHNWTGSARDGGDNVVPFSPWNP